LARPGIASDASEELLKSHAASASAIVFETRPNVVAAVARCFGAAGIAPMGATRNGGRAHVSFELGSSIQSCTASAAQPDGSVETTLWPMQGARMILHRGKWAMTDCAPAVGVRMSKPPLSARTGTFGNPPAARST